MDVTSPVVIVLVIAITQGYPLSMIDEIIGSEVDQWHDDGPARTRDPG